MASQVRISRLDEIEIARASFLSPDEKKRSLRGAKRGSPPYHLNAVRSHFLDLLGVTPNPLFTFTRLEWKKLRASIRQACRHSKKERIANVQLGKGLFLYAEARAITGVATEFHSLSLGITDETLRYWCNAILYIDEIPYVVFIDARSTRGITRRCFPYVFSMMHAAIREGRDDRAAVRFAIVKFGPVKNGARTVRFFAEPDGFKPIPYEAMKTDARDTYKVWGEVIQERVAEKRAA